MSQDYSQEPLATAILAALNAALPAQVRAYDYDTLPDPRPAKHVIIDLSRRWVPERRASGEVTVPGGRLVTRYVARTVSDARELRRRVTAVLEDVAIALPLGGTVGPFTFETEDPIESESGWSSGADSWTY